MMDETVTLDQVSCNACKRASGIIKGTFSLCIFDEEHMCH